MTLNWPSIFPTVPSEKMGYGIAQFHAVNDSYFDWTWAQEGTLLCHGRGKNRVGFAIRQATVSWHFRNQDLLTLYWDICNFGTMTNVTIQFQHGEEYSEDALRFILSKTATELY